MALGARAAQGQGHSSWVRVGQPVPDQLQGGQAAVTSDLRSSLPATRLHPTGPSASAGPGGPGAARPGCPPAPQGRPRRAGSDRSLPCGPAAGSRHTAQPRTSDRRAAASVPLASTQPPAAQPATRPPRPGASQASSRPLCSAVRMPHRPLGSPDLRSLWPQRGPTSSGRTCAQGQEGPRLLPLPLRSSRPPPSSPEPTDQATCPPNSSRA